MVVFWPTFMVGWLLSWDWKQRNQPVPPGVTAQVRETDTEKFIFLLNFEAAPQTVCVDDPATVDALSGQPISGEIPLAGYDFRIIKTIDLSYNNFSCADLNDGRML